MMKKLYSYKNVLLIVFCLLSFNMIGLAKSTSYLAKVKVYKYSSVPLFLNNVSSLYFRTLRDLSLQSDVPGSRYATDEIIVLTGGNYTTIQNNNYFEAEIVDERYGNPFIEIIINEMTSDQTSSSTVGGGGGSMAIKTEELVPIDSCVFKKYIVNGRLLQYEIELIPLTAFSIQPLLTGDYSSQDKVVLSCLQTEYTTNAYVWEYRVGSGSYSTFPRRGSRIEVSLEDLKGASPGDEIYFRLKLANNYSKVVNFRYYPDLPYPIFVGSQKISMGETYLDSLTIRIDRPLNEALLEQFTVLTVYDSMIYYVQNGNLISESRVVFQQDISNVHIPSILELKIPVKKRNLIAKQYYLSMEGSVRGVKNTNVKGLNPNTQMAIFKLVPFTITNSTVKLESVDISAPICYNERGKVKIQLQKKLMIKGEKNVIYVKQNNEWKLVDESSEFLFEISLFPGDYEIRVANNMFFLESIFSVTIPNVQEIDFPIYSKDIGGLSYKYNIPQIPTPGYVIVEREKVENGLAPYVFSYTKNDDIKSRRLSSDTIFTQSPISYEVAVIDANGCRAKKNAIIDRSLDSLQIRVSHKEDLPCFEKNEARIFATLEKGKNVKVSWYKDNILMLSSSLNLEGLSQGLYTIQIKSNVSPLESVDSVYIFQPSPLIIKDMIVDVKCKGEAEGQVKVDVQGGTPPYSYLWNENKNVRDLIDAQAGFYHLNVSDANACFLKKTFEIKEPSKLLDIEILNIDDPYVNKRDQEIGGRVELNVRGGIPPYSYCWSDENVQLSRTNLQKGVYTFKAKDFVGCEKIKEIKLDLLSKLDLFSAQLIYPHCFNANDGEINLQIQGGKKPYSYQWSTGQSSEKLMNLVAGEYEVLVKDKNNEEMNILFAITQPQPLEIFEVKVKHLTYGGAVQGEFKSFQSDGMIEVFMKGGTPPYQYLWNTGSCLSKIDSLNSGVYSLQLSDTNGCSENFSFEIEERLPLVAKIQIIDSIRCYSEKNGKIQGLIQGGLPPYRWVWVKNNKDTIRQESLTLSSLSQGIYELIVTDSNQIQSNYILHLQEPQPISIVSKMIISPTYHACEPNFIIPTEKDGIILLSVSGGNENYRYLWSHQDSYLSEEEGKLQEGLKAGVYSVQIEDRKRCELRDTIVIQNIEPMVAFIREEQSIQCSGDKTGELEVEVVGGVSPYTYFWSNLETTSKIKNLKADVYMVTIKDANLKTIVLKYKLGQPTALDLTYQTLASFCYGDSSGLITVLASGGVSPYQYQWSNGQKGDSCKKLESETLTLIVKDSNSCLLQREISIVSPPKMVIMADTTNPSYEGVKYKKNPPEPEDGYIYIRVSGGSGGYNYIWEHTSENTNSLYGLKNGKYNVFVEDQNRCRMQRNFELSSQPNLTVEVNLIQNPLCYADSGGAFRFNIKGGQPPYSFMNNGKQLEDTVLMKLPQGNYEVKVKDVNGVESVDSIYLWHPSQLGMNVRIDSVSGWGASDGKIKIQAYGGIPPYSYQWEGGEIDNEISGLKVGFYKLKLQDQNNCNLIQEFEVHTPDSLRITSKIKNCDYEGAKQGIEPSPIHNGEIAVSVSGGVLPYYFQWGHTLENSPLISKLAPNKYYLKITDAKGYFLLDSFVIEQPQCLVAHIVQDIPIRCQGGKDAKLKTIVKGGIPPYSYKWANGKTDSVLLHLDAGEYQVIVQDSKNISSSFKINIDEPPHLEIGVNVDSVTGYGRNDGALAVFAQGGTPPYKYCGVDREEYQEQSVWTKLGSGLYTLYVIDQNGCKDSLWTVIHSPSILDAEIIVQSTAYGGIRFGEKDSVPANGKIKVNPQGGIPPYRFQWSNGDTNQELKGLPKGYYFLQIKDKFLNEKSVLVEIKQNDFLNADVQVLRKISCYGAWDGALTAEVKGGVPPYRYYWNDILGGKEIHSLPYGVYYLKVVDSNQIESHYKYLFEQHDSITLTLDVEDISCKNANNGKLQINASGGLLPYQYYLNGNKVDFICTNLSQGLYVTQVIDANNCKSEREFEIKSPDSLIAHWNIKYPTYTGTQESKEGEKLFDGELLILPIGGTPPYRFEWNTSDTTSGLKGIGDGLYEVNVYDSNACRWRKNFKIQSPNPLKVEINHYSYNKCYKDSLDELQAIISGGIPPYKVIWNSMDTSLRQFSIESGNYTFTVRDSLEVNAVKSIYVKPVDPMVLEVDKKNPQCFSSSDGEIFVKVKGGSYPYSYTWNNLSRNSFLSNIGEGSYILKVEDKFQCLIQDTIDLEEPSPLQLDVEMLYPSCSQDIGEVWVSVSGGNPPYSYLWNHQGSLVETKVNRLEYGGQDQGPYMLTVKDSNFCSTDTLITLTPKLPLQLHLDSLRFVCAGQSIILHPEITSISTLEEDSVSLVYLWTLPNGDMQNSPQIKVEQEGNYSLTLIENGSCFYYDTVYVNSSQDSISSLFLINTDMYTEESFLAVNISHPKPDSVLWILPSQAKCLDQNGDYVELLFSDTGYFSLKLITYKGQCVEIRETSIYVQDYQLKINKHGVSILEYAEVYPNPVKDRCNVKYRLSETGKINWTLLNAVSSVEISSGYWNGNKGEENEKDLGSYFSHKGVYILLLRIGNETKLFKLIHM